MVNFELTDEEREALIAPLSQAIRDFPLSSRVPRWKQSREKLGGKASKPERTVHKPSR